MLVPLAGVTADQLRLTAPVLVFTFAANPFGMSGADGGAIVTTFEAAESPAALNANTL